MRIENLYKHLLFLFSLVSFIGAIVYYFYSLNFFGIAIALFLVILVYIIILRFFPEGNTKKENKASPIKRSDRIILYLSIIFFISSFKILLNARTNESLLSPWQIIPSYFFILLFCYLAVLIFQIANNRKFFIVSLSLFCFLVFSIAITLFPLGFGFDPFVHQATLELIQKEGLVNPKPPYYLGEYSLLTILNILPFTALKIIHYYLIPFLTALFLPITLQATLKSWFENIKTVNFTILFLLILPFSIFTISTPQNLAWLFLLLTVIIGLKCDNYRDLFLMLILSLAATVTQAIAGLPALFLTLLIALHHSDLKRKKIYIGLSTMLMSLALPMIFFFLNDGKLTLSKSSVFSSFSFLKINNPNSENIILNTVYFFINNLPFLILVLIVGGIYLANRYKKHCQSLYIYLLSAIAMLTSYLLILRLDFAYLIEYEQANFAKRLLITVSIFFLPFILISLYKFISQVKKQNIFIKISIITFLTILIPISIYASFPRFDHYHNSHSYTVSFSDIEAVNWIEADSENRDYIVLSNQQVAAAALHEFGFKKYYLASPPFQGGDREGVDEPIFFYPIPTGGPLYQYYLDMVYKYPSKETMVSAMNLTNTNLSYFVLNKYWWAFDKILAEAKLEADSYHSINNGEIIIFKYTRN